MGPPFEGRHSHEISVTLQPYMVTVCDAVSDQGLFFQIAISDKIPQQGPWPD